MNTYPPSAPSRRRLTYLAGLLEEPLSEIYVPIKPNGKWLFNEPITIKQASTFTLLFHVRTYFTLRGGGDPRNSNNNKNVIGGGKVMVAPFCLFLRIFLCKQRRNFYVDFF